MAKFTEQEGVRFAELENETVYERFEDGQAEPSYLVGGNEYIPDTEWNNANNDNPIDGVFKYDASHGKDTIYVKIEDGVPVEVTRELDEVRNNVEINISDTGEKESVVYYTSNSQIEVKYDNEFGLFYTDVTIDGKQAAIYDLDESAIFDPEKNLDFKAVVVGDDGEIKAYEFIAGDNGEFYLPRETEYNGNELVKDESRPYTIEGADTFEKDCKNLETEHPSDVEKEINHIDIENQRGNIEVTIYNDGPCNVEVHTYDRRDDSLRSTDDYYDGFHVFTKYSDDGTEKSVLYLDVDGEKSKFLGEEIRSADGELISYNYNDERIEKALEIMAFKSDGMSISDFLNTATTIEPGNLIDSFKDIVSHDNNGTRTELNQEKTELLKNIISLSDKLQDAFDNGDRKSADRSVFDERKEITSDMRELKADIMKSSPDSFHNNFESLQERMSLLEERVDSVCEQLGVTEKNDVEVNEDSVERVVLPESLNEKADDILKEKYDELSKVIGDFDKKIDYFKDDTSRAEVIQECLSFIRDNFGTDEITAMVIDKMEPEKYATEIKYKDENVQFSVSVDGQEKYADVYKDKDGDIVLDRREVMDASTEKLTRIETYFGDAQLGKIDYFNDAQQNILTVNYTENGQVDSYVEKTYDENGALTSEDKHGDIYRENTIYKEDGSTEKFIYMPTNLDGKSFELVGTESADKDGLVSANFDKDKIMSSLDTIEKLAEKSEISQEKLDRIHGIKESIVSSDNQEDVLEKIQEVNDVFVSERDNDAYNEKIEFVKMIDTVIDGLESEISKMDTSKLSDSENSIRDSVLDELHQLKTELFEGDTDKTEDGTAEERYEKLVSSLSDQYGEDKITELLSSIEMADNLIKKEFPELEEDKKDKVDKDSDKDTDDKPSTVADAIKSYLDKTESTKDADSLKDDKDYQNAKKTYEKYMEWKDSLKESIASHSDLIPKSQDYYIARDRMMVTKYERALCFIAKDNPEIADQLGKTGFKDGMGSLKEMYSSISAFNRSDYWSTLISRAIDKFLDSKDNLYDRPIFSKEDVKKEPEMTRGDILNKVITSLGNVDKEGYAKFETDVFRAQATEVERKENDVEKKETEEAPANDVDSEDNGEYTTLDENGDTVASEDEEVVDDPIDTVEEDEDLLEKLVEQEEDETDDTTVSEQRESQVENDENENPLVEMEESAQADSETSRDEDDSKVEKNDERESQATTDNNEDDKKKGKVETEQGSRVDNVDSKTENKEASVDAKSGQKSQFSTDDKHDKNVESKVSNDGSSGVDAGSSKEDGKGVHVEVNETNEGKTTTDEQNPQISTEEQQESQTGIGDQQGSAVSAQQNAENVVSKDDENTEKTIDKEETENLDTGSAQEGNVAVSGGSGVAKNEDDEIDVTEVSEQEVDKYGSAAEEIYDEIKEKIGEYIDSASEKDEDGYRTGDVEFSDIKDTFEENGIEFNEDTFTDVFSDFFREAYNEGISFAGDGVFSIMENAASEIGMSFLELCDGMSSALDNAQDGLGDIFYENLSDGISLTNIDTPDYEADIRFSFGDTEFHITASGDDVDVLKEVNGSVEFANIDATTLEDALLDISRDKLGDIFADNLDMVADNMVEISNGEIDKADAIMSIFENTDDVMTLTDHALDAQQAAQMATEMIPQEDDHQDVDIDPEKMENLQNLEGATEAAEGMEAEEIIALLV